MFACAECVFCKNDAADCRKITFFSGFFAFFADFSCAASQLCACVGVFVCVYTVAAGLVCEVATCGISHMRSNGTKDIWALAAFQLIPHLRRQEDET